MLAASVLERLCAALGEAHVRTDEATRTACGIDALGRGAMPDVVVRPGDTAEVAAVARLCHQTRTPLVPRGAGTGYSGGAVPVAGGVVISLERLNRILDIDVDNLLAVVEPAVITGALQRAVERVGLFYPPAPASLDQSSIELEHVDPTSPRTVFVAERVGIKRAVAGSPAPAPRAGPAARP